jgi:5-methylcytosine-specific restriction endonuclease McrA
MARRRKASPVKVTKADGTTEIVKAGAFRRPGFNYARYRRSRHWQEIRALRFERDGHRCQDCKGKSGDPVLEVHHLTYDRLGRERLEDLVTLCQRCHSTRHAWQMR